RPPAPPCVDWGGPPGSAHAPRALPVHLNGACGRGTRPARAGEEVALMKTVQSLLETANAVVPRVSPEETERLLAAGQALVVDVRDEPEIAATGCIPG